MGSVGYAYGTIRTERYAVGQRMDVWLESLYCSDLFLADCKKLSQETSPLPLAARLYLDALRLCPLKPAAAAIVSGCAMR